MNKECERKQISQRPEKKIRCKKISEKRKGADREAEERWRENE